MKLEYLAPRMLLVLLPVSALGCDRNTETSDSEEGSASPGPSCEIASVVELEDADTVAPNGRTGSEILAAIPESYQTALHWDLSQSDVEVEIDGVSGQSSALSLTFTLPADPQFHFKDLVAVPDPDAGVAVICDDYVTTTLDVHAETQDGALSADFDAVEVRLGTHDPNNGLPLIPFTIAIRPLTSPVVNFVAPVVQPADSEKHLALSFDTPGVTGEITAYATDSNETHRMIVARW